MLGRELRLPIDVVFPPPRDESHLSYPEYLEELERRLTLASEYARAHLRLSFDNMSLHNPPSRVIRPIDLTKEVYLFNPSLKRGISPKMASFWRGPYKVLEKISSYLYRVAVGGRRGSQVVHRSHLFQPRIASNDSPQLNQRGKRNAM
jgi:hypothetical protein